MSQQRLCIFVFDWGDHSWATRKTEECRRQERLEFFERLMEPIPIGSDKRNLLVDFSECGPLRSEPQIRKCGQGRQAIRPVICEYDAAERELDQIRAIPVSAEAEPESNLSQCCLSAWQPEVD
jgi:hypothetical protein